MSFQLASNYQPKGDQAQAIAKLTKSIEAGNRPQTLLGVTGSGKTFNAANIIRNLDRPTLVISHNKTLAAQLYSEFKQFFPKNAVEYFVSYFDYYQPEAYIPRTDTYIKKDSSINEEIERLRLSATSSLLSRRDVLVVASVSCIYGLGSPEDYANMVCNVFKSQPLSRELFLAKLVDMLYERNDLALTRGKFRVRGDVVEVHPATADEEAVRVEFFGDEIDQITVFDPLTGSPTEPLDRFTFFPAKQFVTPYEKMRRALTAIRTELDDRPLNFPEFMGMTNQVLYISATPADFEIQNSMVGNDSYIPHARDRIGQEETEPVLLPMLTGRSAGQLDVHTPGSRLVVQQIIRPTGLLDPRITIRPLKNQIDETIELCRARSEKGERVLITNLTKRTAEDLTDYLRDVGLKVRYLHSEIDAIERVEILRSLRAGDFDVLVGINLLREGLDLPEVSLVCILDADKEGFLRSQTSLIQTAGRAARHVNGEVVLFADTMTESIQRLIAITEYRRGKQMEYNEANGVTPTSVRRAVQESLHTILRGRDLEQSIVRETGADLDLTEVLRGLEAEMQTAAANLEYERAALLRDQINELKNGTGLSKIEPKNRRPVSYRSSKTPKKGRAKHH